MYSLYRLLMLRSPLQQINNVIYLIWSFKHLIDAIIPFIPLGDCSYWGVPIYGINNPGFIHITGGNELGVDEAKEFILYSGKYIFRTLH